MNKIKKTMKKCLGCGKKVPDDTVRCPHCHCVVFKDSKDKSKK